MLTASEIRKRYLDFFSRKAHKIEKSSSLIPEGDPSLLFTNAGMVQFKDYFLGDPNKPFSRAATCQKCLRVSGKHNDLENVGRTARHHTFFEMLGNFSFGDYFKKDAIAWAWEFVTEELNLPKDRLWVTVYKDDDEAAKIWKEVAGLPDERIVKMGEKDNFWSMGDEGPCGPCSEIYIDQGEGMACGPDCGIGKCDCDRFLEIWNLVFTQFDQQKDGSRLPLAAPNIDTGMGLERIAAVCQGKQSNFDCDLFQELIQYAAGLANVQYSYSAPDTNDTDTALRVIADHARSAAFLVAEGVIPSNEGRGYVLRRLIRRALRFGTLMGLEEPFLYKVSDKVVDIMGNTYPELREQRDFINRVVQEEEKRFALTLENGLNLLNEELDQLEASGVSEIPGEISFKLYDTYGFPIDIIMDVGEKRGFTVDQNAFENLMKLQRDRARENQKKSAFFGKGQDSVIEEITSYLDGLRLNTEFTGYSSLNTNSPVLALFDEKGHPANELKQGESGFLLAEKTPFYAEAGGQVADSGKISCTDGRARVLTVFKIDKNHILHKIEVTEGRIKKGDSAELSVDPDERKAVARNHTCTHLLHAAIRRVLGTHAHQAGSLVDAQRLRFDFSHLSALKKEELAAIERQVNAAIMADLPVNACIMNKDAAMERGAMALFSEKYGDNVRVLTIGDEQTPESLELCGGTHLDRTGEAGSFYIMSESGVAAGVRRIEAVTGWNAYGETINNRSITEDCAAILKSQPANLREKIASLLEELKSLRKLARKSDHSSYSVEDIAKKAQKHENITVLTANIPGVSIKALREIMDDLRGRFSKSYVIALAGEDKGKPALIASVSKDLHAKITAPSLIKSITAICGGAGGGRPDLAQAGGCDPSMINQALASIPDQLPKDEIDK